MLLGSETAWWRDARYEKCRHVTRFRDCLVAWRQIRKVSACYSVQRLSGGVTPDTKSVCMLLGSETAWWRDAMQIRKMSAVTRFRDCQVVWRPMRHVTRFRDCLVAWRQIRKMSACYLVQRLPDGVTPNAACYSVQRLPDGCDPTEVVNTINVVVWTMDHRGGRIPLCKLHPMQHRHTHGIDLQQKMIPWKQQTGLQRLYLNIIRESLF